MMCHNEDVKRAYAADPEPTIRRAEESHARLMAENPERVRARLADSSRNRRYMNPDRVHAYEIASRGRHRETRRRWDRERYAADPQKERERGKAYKAANPDKTAAQFKKWCAENPEKVKERYRNKRARRRGAEGKHTEKDIRKLRVRQRDKCAFCFTPLGGKGHVDHIIPLAREGSNWPTNLQLLCVAHNTAKGARTMEEFFDYVFKQLERKRMTEQRAGLARERVATVTTDHKEATGTRTCSVALKMPNGIILQAQQEEDDVEAAPGGFKAIKVWRPAGDPFALKGNAKLFGPQRDIFGDETGGYAITNGVPLDLWETWYAQNKSSMLVKNGLIFACSTEAEAMIEGKNRSKMRSGMEPIDPDNPAAATGMRKGKNVGGIQAAERPN